MLAAPTDFVLDAQRQLRDPALFKWYAVALLAFVVYAYANEVERGRYDIVAAGLAIWFADWSTRSSTRSSSRCRTERRSGPRPGRPPTSSSWASTSRRRSCSRSP